VQSSMLAFSKIYLYSGLVLLCALPLLLLFRTGRARGSMGPVQLDEGDNPEQGF